MPSAIEYLWSSSPKTSLVVLSFMLLTSMIGVPVKPNLTALGKVSLMEENMSPKTSRWASSTIKRMCLELIFSISFLRDFKSSPILHIFWCEVTMRASFLLSLFSLLTRTSVFSVACTSMRSPAKFRYDCRDWVPSSILSIRNTTLSA